MDPRVLARGNERADPADRARESIDGRRRSDYQLAEVGGILAFRRFPLNLDRHVTGVSRDHGMNGGRVVSIQDLDSMQMSKQQPFSLHVRSAQSNPVGLAK
jgi:hypothetical protein